MLNNNSIQQTQITNASTNVRMHTEMIFNIDKKDILINKTTKNSELKPTEKKQFRKNLFTVAEDKILLSLVNKYGKNNWPLISNCMKQYNFDRNVRQCKDRYFHYLNPTISNYINWTAEEDDLLLKFVQKFGKKWKLSENLFLGRTEVSIRNRYQVIMRKIVRNQKFAAKNQKMMKKKQTDFINKFFKKYSNKKNSMIHQKVEDFMENNAVMTNKSIQKTIDSEIGELFSPSESIDDFEMFNLDEFYENIDF